MFEEELYITIAGAKHYFGTGLFAVGTLVSLKKEPENPYDEEAIAVLAPALGHVGYVANSVQTVAAGTMSAGRLHNHMPAECVAVVRFIAGSKVIARVIPDKRLKVKIEVTLEDNAESPVVESAKSILQKAPDIW